MGLNGDDTTSTGSPQTSTDTKLPTLSARSLARSDRFSHQRPRNKPAAAQLGSRWSFRNYPLRLRIRQLITSIVSVFLTMQLSILIALPFPQCRFPSPRGRRINLFSPRPQIRDNAGGRQDEDGGFLESHYEKLDRSGGRPQRSHPRRVGHGVATRESAACPIKSAFPEPPTNKALGMRIL